MYPLATVTAPTLAAGYLLNFNTGMSLPPVTSFDPGDGPTFWFAIDRAVTRQSGARLLGPPANEVFASFPFHELLEAVIASVEAHSDPQEEHLLDDAVLNGCRALCFACDHRWFAKLDAAERTLPMADTFASIVEQAMVSFRSGRDQVTPLTREAVQAFLLEVLRRLRAGSPVGEPGGGPHCSRPAVREGSW